MSIKTILVAISLGLACQATSQVVKTLVVDQLGGGDFRTIQDAINSLPDSSKMDRVITIKKGTYREKVMITKNHIVLQGDDAKNTLITFSLSRDIWRCEGHDDDWGVATLNLMGSDITIKNLTIINSYGFDRVNGKDTVVGCNDKGVITQKTVRNSGHQMALRSFQTTRLKVIGCVLRAYGGDTVSPWNGTKGLYYFKNCVMEGGVDFYCPRGWAYAEGCIFICHSNVASIWHDGSKNERQKTTLKNCIFRGDAGYKLGRYHMDSQFYLIDCSFEDGLADAPIYRVPGSKEIKWGERVYFYNCHKKNGDYAWLQNNLAKAPGSPLANSISATWAFDGQWNPVN